VAIAILTAFLVVFLNGLIHAQTPQVPLNVAIVASDPARPSISVAVTNTSGEPITAYAVEVTITGQVKPVRIPRQIDGFYVADQRPLLAPNQTTELDFPLPHGVSMADVSVSATAVILENTTVVGSQALGELILKGRAEKRDDMRYWLSLIKDLMIKNADSVALRGMGARAIQAIRADTLMSDVGRPATLKALAELEPVAAANATRSLTADSLHGNLRRLAAMNPAEREASVLSLLELLEREYANAVKHAGRVK